MPSGNALSPLLGYNTIQKFLSFIQFSSITHSTNHNTAVNINAKVSRTAENEIGKFPCHEREISLGKSNDQNES